MSSIYVISAMCGCWRRESGVNPGIWESLIPCAWNYKYEYTGRGGYGLGQWTNVGTSDGRLWRLHTWVTQHGYGDGSGPGQIAYIPVEGYWNGSYNGTGDNSQTRGSYGSLSAFLNSDSTDIADLVWDFLANWEGVPGDHYDERLGYAQNFLAYLQEHGGESGSWTSRNNYLSTSEMNNNVLSIYNLLSGETPTPTPPGPDQYAITVTTSGNGSAWASQVYGSLDDVITLHETPDEGSEFLGWNVISDNTTIEDNQFVMPDSDVYIEAVFSGSAKFHTITVRISGRGTASASKGYAESGDIITLTAEPDGWAIFYGWTVVSGDITINNNRFTMPDEDVIIEAIFYDVPVWMLYQWDRIRRKDMRI